MPIDKDEALAQARADLAAAQDAVHAAEAALSAAFKRFKAAAEAAGWQYVVSAEDEVFQRTQYWASPEASKIIHARAEREGGADWALAMEARDLLEEERHPGVVQY